MERPPASKSPIKVLLVDDEKAFLTSAAKALTRRGLVTTTASNGSEARLVFHASHFDVAVLDVRLPDEDGHKLFYEFKRAAPNLQVIMLTGHGDVGRAFEMSREGLYAYIPKPCDIDELAQLIFHATGGRPAGTEPKSPRDDKPVSVLLVDDETSYLDSMKRVLERRGFIVLTAESGEEGLKLLRRHDPDVAVVDIKMPGISGMEVLEKAKAEKPEVEIILLTGHATIDTAVKGMEKGAFDYLLKPHDPDDLALKITVAAEQKRSKT